MTTSVTVGMWKQSRLTSTSDLPEAQPIFPSRTERGIGLLHVKMARIL